MSNFDHTTFSPSTDTALEEPVAIAQEQQPAAQESAGAQTERAPGQRTTSKLFHYVLLLYIYLFCTRLPELFPQVRASLALSVILLAGAFATGQVAAIARTRVGKILIAFAIWTAACVPFSFWPGGSVDQLKTTVQSTLLVAFIVAFVKNMQEVRNLLYTLGAAMGTIAVLSLTTYRADSIQGERLGFGESGSLQDPNFMALYLLIGLPFLYMGVVRGKGLMRILFALLIPVALLGIGRSGSRMALIELVVGFIIFMWRASQKERVFVTVATAAIVMVTLPVLPKGVVERFTTMFQSKQSWTSATSPQAGSSEAAESAQSRWDLLMRSLELTARYPIFGVGPGQFTTADDQLARAEGGPRGMWHYTHNAYTQTSSESGIPGVLLYIAALVSSWRGVGRIYKRVANPQVREMAKYVQLSLLMVILGGFFLTIGFGGVPFVVMGVCIVFQLAAAPYMRQAKAAPAA